MKKTLQILLAMLLLASAFTTVASAQGLSTQKCPTCGKSYSECPYHFSHPKQSSTSTTSGRLKKSSKEAAKQRVAEEQRRQQAEAEKQRAAEELRLQQEEAEKQRIIQQAIDDMVWVELPLANTTSSTHKVKQGDTLYGLAKRYGKRVDDIFFANPGVKELQVGQELVIPTTLSGYFIGKYEVTQDPTTPSGYFIGKYEVTQELWQAVMGNNLSILKGDPRRPVENVSWHDCQKFILKLNQLTGKRFRLPTHLEWEYAAHGGSSSNCYTRYSGSAIPDSVAWYKDNSGKMTHPVGQKSPNELGLYDMSGNVYEWCQDCNFYYNRGETMNSERVLCGGSYATAAGEGISVDSAVLIDSHHKDQCGLRLAL